MATGLSTFAGWIALHALIGFLGTALARNYALRAHLLDQPGERRSHVAPTPRGGGIAMVGAMLLACLWLGLRWPESRLAFAAFAGGLLLVAGVGWLDDHRPLSIRLRLAVHALAALLLGLALWSETGRGELAVAAAVLALVLTNIWNFMDGIDGLAASQAGLVAAVLACVLPLPWSLLALALAAASLGFLPWNLPRARIFMGDVGSGALGFSLAGLLVLAVPALPRHWPLLALPVSAFIADAGLTLLARLLRGERWWLPHTSHGYQRWARRDGHGRVTAAYALWTASAGMFMMAAAFAGDDAVWRGWPLGLTAAVFGLAALAWSRLDRTME